VRAAIEFRERLTALRGQAELILPPILRHGLAGEQPVLVELLDDAAEVAGIQAQFQSDALRGRALAMGKFVQHPRLAQRERAFEQLLVEDAELARIEAGERAHR
jgi:hypothetical protein